MIIPQAEMRFVHFEPATGRIRQVSTGAFRIEGLAAAHPLETDTAAIDGNLVKVDVASLGEIPLIGVPTCRLIETAEHERIVLPPYATLEGVKAHRDRALGETDAFMAADRPMAEAERAQWRHYRQTLRDLGQHQSAEDFVAAWPMRPDGKDDIATVRAAFAASEKGR